MSENEVENYFKLSHEVYEDSKFLKMSSSSIKLYVILCKLTNYYTKEGEWFFRSINELVNDSKMSLRTISMAKKELIKNNFIEVKRSYMKSTNLRSYDSYRVLGYRFKK